MTRTSPHRRSDVLRAVIQAADERRDGRLPTDVAGVADTFANEADLLGALSLRWAARLSGRVDRELYEQPLDPERAVATAWAGTAESMPGVRAVLDRALDRHAGDDVARTLRKAADKEHAMLALASGRVRRSEPTSVRAGEALVRRARGVEPPPFHQVVEVAPAAGRAGGVAARRRATAAGLVHRIRAVLAA